VIVWVDRFIHSLVLPVIWYILFCCCHNNRNRSRIASNISTPAEARTAPPQPPNVTILQHDHSMLEVQQVDQYDIHKYHDVSFEYYFNLLVSNFKAANGGNDRFTFIKTKNGHFLLKDGNNFVFKGKQTSCDARNFLLELHDVGYHYESWKEKRDAGGYNHKDYKSNTTPPHS